MKLTSFALATAVAVLIAAPFGAKAGSDRLAQVVIETPAPAAPAPGVVIEEPRRPGVVIESEGSARPECRSVTVDEWRDGVKISRTERRCDR